MVIFALFLLGNFLIALSPSSLDFNMVMEYSTQQHTFLGKRQRENSPYPKKKEKLEKGATHEEQDFLKRKERLIQALEEERFEDVYQGIYFIAYRNRLIKGYQQDDEKLLKIDLELLFVVSRECSVIHLKKYIMWVIEEKDLNIESLLENKVSFEMTSPLDKNEYFRIKFIEVFLDWNQRWRNQVTDISLADQGQLEIKDSEQYNKNQRFFDWSRENFSPEQQEELKTTFRLIMHQIEEKMDEDIFHLLKYFIEKCREKRTMEEFYESLSWFWTQVVISVNQKDILDDVKKEVEAKIGSIDQEVKKEHFDIFHQVMKILILEKFQGEERKEMLDEVKKMWFHTYMYSSNIKEQTEKIRCILKILKKVDDLIGEEEMSYRPFEMTIKQVADQRKAIYKGVFRCSILNLEGMNNIKIAVEGIPHACYEARIGTLSTVIVFLQTRFTTESFVRVFREEWLTMNRMCGQYIDSLRKKRKKLGSLEVHVRPTISESLASKNIHLFYQKFRGEAKDSCLGDQVPAVKVFLNKEFNRQGGLDFFIFSFLNEYEHYPSLNSDIRGQKTSDIIKEKAIKFARSQLDCNLKVEDYIDTEPLLEGEEGEMSLLVKIHWYFRLQEQKGLVLRCQQEVPNTESLFINEKELDQSEEKMDISEAHMWLKKINILQILNNDNINEDMSYCWKELLNCGIENEEMAKEVIRCLEIGLLRNNTQGIQEILFKGDEVITALLKFNARNIMIQSIEIWMKQMAKNEEGRAEVEKYQTTVIQLVSCIALESEEYNDEFLKTLDSTRFILFFYVGIGNEVALDILLSSHDFFKEVEIYGQLMCFSLEKSCYQEIQQGIWIFLRAVLQEDSPVPNQVTDEYILKMTACVVQLLERISEKLFVNSKFRSPKDTTKQMKESKIIKIINKYENILGYLFYKIENKEKMLSQISLLRLSSFYFRYWSDRELNQLEESPDQVDSFYDYFDRVVQYAFQNLEQEMVSSFDLRSAIIVMDQYGQERREFPWDQEMLDEEEKDGDEKVNFVIKIIKELFLKRKEKSEWQKAFFMSIIDLIESDIKEEDKKNLLETLNDFIKKNHRFLDLKVIIVDLIELSLKNQTEFFEHIFFEVVPLFYMSEKKGSGKGDLIVFKYSLEFILDQFQNEEYQQLIFQKILFKCIRQLDSDQATILFNFYEEIKGEDNVEKLLLGSLLGNTISEFVKSHLDSFLLKILGEVKRKNSFLYKFVLNLSEMVLFCYIRPEASEQNQLEKALRRICDPESGKLSKKEEDLMRIAGMVIIILKDMWIGISMQTGIERYSSCLSPRLPLTSQARLGYIDFVIKGRKELEKMESVPSLFKTYLEEKGIAVFILDFIYNLETEEKMFVIDNNVFEKFVKENSQYVVTFLNTVAENNCYYRVGNKNVSVKLPIEIHSHSALKKKNDLHSSIDKDFYLDKEQLTRMLKHKCFYKEFFRISTLMQLDKEDFKKIEEGLNDSLSSEETRSLIEELIQTVLEINSSIVSPITILNHLSKVLSAHLLGEYGIEQITTENTQFKSVDLCDLFLSWDLIDEDRVRLIKQLLEVVIERKSQEEFLEVQQKLLLAGNRFSFYFVEGLIEEKRKHVFYEWLNSNIEQLEFIERDHFDIFKFMRNHSRTLIEDEEKRLEFILFISSFVENNEKYAKATCFWRAWTLLLENEFFEKKYLEKVVIEWGWTDEDLLKVDSVDDARLLIEEFLKMRINLYWIEEVREILWDLNFNEEEFKRIVIDLIYENYKETGEEKKMILRFCQFTIKNWHDHLELSPWNSETKTCQEKKILKIISKFLFFIIENPEEIEDDEQFAFYIYLEVMNEESRERDVCTIENIKRVEEALQKENKLSLKMVQVLKYYTRLNLWFSNGETGLVSEPVEKGIKRKYEEMEGQSGRLEEIPLKKVKEGERSEEEADLERSIFFKKGKFVPRVLSMERKQRMELFKYFDLGHHVDFVVEVIDYLFNESQYTMEKFDLLCDILSMLDQSLTHYKIKERTSKKEDLSCFFIFLFESMNFLLRSADHREDILKTGLITIYHMGIDYQYQDQEILSREYLNVIRARHNEWGRVNEIQIQSERYRPLWSDLNLHWVRWRDEGTMSHQMDECIVAMILFFIKDTLTYERPSEKYVKELEECRERIKEEIVVNRKTVLQKVKIKHVLKYEVSCLMSLKQSLKKYHRVELKSMSEIKNMNDHELKEHFENLFLSIQDEYEECIDREISEEVEENIKQLIDCLVELSYEDQKDLLEKTIGKSSNQRIRYDIFKRVFFMDGEEVDENREKVGKFSEIMELLIFDPTFNLKTLKRVGYVKGNQKDLGIILLIIFFENVVNFRGGGKEEDQVKLMIFYLHYVMTKEQKESFFNTRVAKKYPEEGLSVRLLISEMIQYNVKGNALKIWNWMNSASNAGVEEREYICSKRMIIKGIADVLTEGESKQSRVEMPENLDNESLKRLSDALKSRYQVLSFLKDFDYISMMLRGGEIEATLESMKGHYLLLLEDDEMESTSAMLIGRSALMATKESIQTKEIIQASYKKIDGVNRLKEIFYQKLTAGYEVYIQEKEVIDLPDSSEKSTEREVLASNTLKVTQDHYRVDIKISSFIYELAVEVGLNESQYLLLMDFILVNELIQTKIKKNILKKGLTLSKKQLLNIESLSLVETFRFLKKYRGTSFSEVKEVLNRVAEKGTNKFYVEKDVENEGLFFIKASEIEEKSIEYAYNIAIQKSKEKKTELFQKMNRFHLNKNIKTLLISA